MTSNIPIASKMSIREAGFDEVWLQTQIYDNPSCLGLGELEAINRSGANHVSATSRNPNPSALQSTRRSSSQSKMCSTNSSSWWSEVWMEGA